MGAFAGGLAGILFTKDIFDETYGLADANLTIFWRSIKLSLLTTATTFAVGFPTAWFIATRPPKARPLWLFLITIPFWTNLLIRTYAMNEVLRSEGLMNTVLIKIGLILDALAGDVHRCRGVSGHDICLSAADGAAALCRHRPL